MMMRNVSCQCHEDVMRMSSHEDHDVDDDDDDDNVIINTGRGRCLVSYSSCDISL